MNNAPREELASRLSQGAVSRGDLSLALVEGELAREVEAFVVSEQAQRAASVEAQSSSEEGGVEALGEEPRSCTPHVLDADAWTDLELGTLVLAADLDKLGVPQAWFEAILIKREGPEFVLRWRDFPANAC